MQGNVRYFADSGLFCHNLPVATSATLTAWVNLFYLGKMVLHGSIRSKRFVFFLTSVLRSPKCRHICLFQLLGRDLSPSESGDES